MLGEVVPAALLAKAGPLGAHSDPQHLLQLEKQALTALAAAVQNEGFRALGWMLNQPAAAGDSIVVVAVQFFFRREVEGALTFTLNMAETWLRHGCHVA